MNFLAHLHLAYPNENLLVGNYIADGLPRSARVHYPSEIIRGVEMHLAIDAFTDAHPIVEESKKLIRPTQHKYAPVVVDMLYDHFLAVDFAQYSNLPLKAFTQKAYAILHKHEVHLPPRVGRMLGYMERDNWLLQYGALHGMQQAFNGMSRRAGFANQLASAPADLTKHYKALQLHFTTFYPELQQHVAHFHKQ